MLPGRLVLSVAIWTPDRDCRCHYCCPQTQQIFIQISSIRVVRIVELMKSESKLGLRLLIHPSTGAPLQVSPFPLVHIWVLIYSLDMGHTSSLPVLKYTSCHCDNDH